MEYQTRRGRTLKAGVAALLVVGLYTTQGFAADAVPASELPPELRQLVQAVISQPRVAPGVVFGSPVAFGARTGDFFIGLNGATASDTRSDFIGGIDVDGSMAIGLGFGNPDKVAMEAAFNIISLTNAFGDSGALAVKLHTNVGDHGAIAFGTENTLAWGDAKDFADATADTMFLSYSHYYERNPGNGLMLTFGIGRGRLGQANDPESISPFISAGYSFTRQMSLIADYAGEAMNIGLSFVPSRTAPISVVVGVTDVTEERGDMEMAVGVGYSSRF